MFRKIVAALSLLVVVCAVGAAAYVYVQCPCDRLPGVRLAGEEVKTPVADWSFANDAGLCQLQVSGGLVPQSLNLNCMSADGELFISCSQCEGKRWSATALANPAGRIQIGNAIYPVTLTRLVDPARLDFAWQARKAKLEGFGMAVTDERPGHWWSFQLESRTGE